MSDPGTPSIDLDVEVIAPRPPVGGDELSLMIGNVVWSGWQRVQLTRSLETVPASFQIEVTERYPNMPNIDIRPGVPCTVQLGGDLVLTGYIDRYNATINARTHTVTIIGRSKSADLVDCAAFLGDPNNEVYQIKGGDTVSIIRDLAAPYGISVASQSGNGVQVQNFNVNLGETAWEIIDRLTRYSQLVAYDLPDGSILLAQAGTESQASGFVQGVNVEAASIELTMDQRYSLYEGFMTSVVVLGTDSGGHQDPRAIARDDGVPRFRKRIIISEQTDTNGDLVTRRVQWEANRRAARSMAVNVTCDSWRDGSNQLWTPNHLAPVTIPALKINGVSWVIGQVTYVKDERGTHALVLLMPPGAFQPEPMVFQPSQPTLTEQGKTIANPTSNNPGDAEAPGP